MGATVEPDVHRRYRHLLRTAALDWQETAHRRALNDLGTQARTRLLQHLRALLGTGYRFGEADIHHLARLIVRAERRTPGLVLDGLRDRDPAMLEHLAARVVDSPIGALLAAGYDIWDGSEPPRPIEPEVPTDHHLRWQAWRGGVEEGWAEFFATYGAPQGRGRRY